MFRSVKLNLVYWLCPGMAFAQTPHHIEKADSLKTEHLHEVVVIAQRSLSDKADKPLATLDNYLEEASTVNMVRRGTYAWEPFLNGMASERSVITIDGMRIYAACTDKMDPVTSYVEITNLAKASIHSGQSGATGGATIAGSLDLVRKKGTFGEEELKGFVFSGFESNNLQKIIGGALSRSQPKFFANFDFTFRDADNYRAGGGKEVLYSQYTKYNVSAVTGYKVDEHQQLEASVIYDHAVDVGYPALPMDVSLARAFIGSLAYSRHHISRTIHEWQTKLYYNDITHVMDDTKRPDVPVRMDMPGWSKTGGFYSKLQGAAGKHHWKSNLSGHFNRSLAEMTMFSNTPGEKDMFMLTWPGVHTCYGDLFVEDSSPLSEKWKVVFSAGAAVHHNKIDSRFGLESLQIFYPQMRASKTRLLKRVSTAFQREGKNWQYHMEAAYGERAPGVSEGYGFYLFNSFDRFDYIGNPDMKNEKSASINGILSFSRSHFSAKLSGSYFHISDYIIGRPKSGLSVMTIGANGVKVYEQLKYAGIFNTSLDMSYPVTERLVWTSRLGYRRGSGKGVPCLPLIQPFTYSSGIAFSTGSFSADAAVNGAARQERYNPEFGEMDLPRYTVFNLSASNRFKIGPQTLTLKAGIENLFDKNYTTFADWNRLPRMGRNVFINLVWNF